VPAAVAKQDDPRAGRGNGEVDVEQRRALRVEDEIDATVAGGGADIGDEVRSPGGDRVVAGTPCRFGSRAAADRAEQPAGPAEPRVLSDGVSHPAGRTVNKHRLARAQATEIIDEHRRADQHTGRGGGHLVAEALGSQDRVAGVRGDEFSQAAVARERGHPLAGAQL
jgi:hypothetical protein